MKIFLYAGIDLSKILSRRLYKPIHSFDLNEYKVGTSQILKYSNTLPMLQKLTLDFTDKIEYKNCELKELLKEAEEFKITSAKETEKEDFIEWIIISIECAINHKKNFYITSQLKTQK